MTKKKSDYMFTYLVVFINLMDITQLGLYPPGGGMGAINSLITYMGFLLNLLFLFVHSPSLPLPFQRLWQLPLTMLVIWACVVVLPSGQTMKAAIPALKLLTTFYFFAVVTQKRRDIFLKALRDYTVVFAILNLLSVIAVPQLGIEQGSHTRVGTWKGLTPFKTKLGVTSMLLLFALVFSPREPNRQKRTWNRVTAFFLVVLIIGSQSRMAWIMLAVVIMLALMFKVLNTRQGRFKLPLFLCFVALLVAIVPVINYISLYILEASGRDLTFSGRLLIWSYFLEVAQRKPFFGYGMSVVVQNEALIAAAHAYAGWDDFVTAHNSIIEWFLNAGYPGAILFSLVVFNGVIYGLKEAWTDRSREGMRTLALALTVIVSVMLTSDAAGSNGTWLGIYMIYNLRTTNRTSRSTYPRNFYQRQSIPT